MHSNLICDKDKDMDSKFTTNRVKFDTLQMVLLSVPRTLIYFAGFSRTTKRRQWQPLWRLRPPTSVSPPFPRLSSATSTSSGFRAKLQVVLFQWEQLPDNPCLRPSECVSKTRPCPTWALLLTRLFSLALIRRYCSVGQVGIVLKNGDNALLDINHQDPVAKALEDFDLFSFLSPTTAPVEMKEYW